MSLSASRVVKSCFRAIGSPFGAPKRFYTVGDKIPINFLKDVPAPEILEDKEYPEWLFKLLDKVCIFKNISSTFLNSSLIILFYSILATNKNAITEENRGKRSTRNDKCRTTAHQETDQQGVDQGIQLVCS